jgi:cob(I)alamin adenosyltransferase
VAKYHLRVEACGVIDEVEAFLGLARATSRKSFTQEVIYSIQKDLFKLGAELAQSPGKGVQIELGDVKRLESLIAQLEPQLPPLEGFLVSGEESGEAVINVARSVVRRAERVAAKLNGQGMLRNSKVLSYLNRLSDLLFLLARYEEA